MGQNKLNKDRDHMLNVLPRCCAARLEEVDCKESMSIYGDDLYDFGPSPFEDGIVYEKETTHFAVLIRMQT